MSRLHRLLRAAPGPHKVLWLGVFGWAFFALITTLTGVTDPIAIMMRDNIAIGFFLMFGACRALVNHPRLKPDYLKWLELSPWKPGKALPFGPIRLGLADVVVVGLALAALYPMHHHWRWIPIAYVLGFSGALMFALRATKVKVIPYVIAFGIGGFLFVRDHTAASLALTAGLYAISYVGIRRSLASFPWGLGTEAPVDDVAEIGPMGWPLDVLAPKKPTPTRKGISLLEGLAVSGILGWWLYAITSTFPGAAQELQGIPVFAALGVGLVRISIYLSGARTPLTLLGRLRTGRLVIPSFDKVWVAPCLALAGGGLSPFLESVGVPLPVAMGFAVYAVFAVGLTLGPSLESWRLTGRYQLDRPKAAANPTLVEV